jgi:hypothetical protein
MTIVSCYFGESLQQVTLLNLIRRQRKRATIGSGRFFFMVRTSQEISPRRMKDVIMIELAPALASSINDKPFVTSPDIATATA